MAQWFYARDGRQAGPVEFAELRALAEQGELLGGDLVWSEGMLNWTPARDVADLLPRVPPTSAQAVPQNFTVAPLPYPSVPAYPVTYETPARKSPHAGLALTAMILSLVSFVLGIGGPCL